MNKNLMTLALALTLSACSGGSDGGPAPDPDPENTPATFAGTSTASIDTSSAAIDNTVTISDVDAGEAVFSVQTDVSTTYGTFSITTDGAWTYAVDTTNTDIIALTSSDIVIDTIIIESADGTTSKIVITISGIDTSELVRNDENDTVPEVVCTQTVSSISELEKAADDVVAGDTLCLADGDYTGPLELSVDAIGTEDNPVTVAAENPGAAIISGGKSYIKLGGEHVIIQGFVLRDGESGSSIIKFEKATECTYCRVTEVSLIDMDGGDFSSSNWVEYYGNHNRIDHSYFSGKESRGVILKLGRWTDGSVYPADYALIDHNYIGDRAPAWGRGYAGSSDNEYEGIRLGLSTTHQDPSYSTVEYNYFERIQGEAEIISNKSANNIIRNNTIRDSNGSIVTRHGEGADISNNFIFGDDNPYAGGIRLVDGEHSVTNNYIEGARFLSSNWNGGIVLTTGDGSEDGENGYQNVTNVLVANNTIVDSVNSLNVSGGKENTAPSGVYLVNNIIADAIGAVIRTNGESMPSGTIDGNYVYGQEFSDNSSVSSVSGISFVDAELERASDGLYRPSSTSPSLTAAVVDTGTFTQPTIDMDGQTRSAITKSGADEELSTDKVLRPLTAADVGPKNYTPTPGKIYVQKVLINNHDFDSGDLTGWTSNGGTVSTDSTEVFSRGKSLKFATNAADASQTVAVTADTNYTLSAFMKGTAQLSITVDGQTYKAERESSSYGFTSVTFNSGAGTSAVITTRVDDGLDIEAVIDSDFVDFKAGGTDWTKFEGDTDGDVGTSSNTASGSDGSAKLGYTKTTHVNASPSISQNVAVVAGEDYNFSFDLLVKDESNGSAVILNIIGDNSVVIADTELTMSDMTDVGLEDYFERFTQTINSADNTTLTVKLSFKPQAINNEAVETGTTDLTSDSKKANELRVDNVSLTVEGAPAEGTEAFFDNVRLVSQPLSAAESCYAEADDDVEDIAVCAAIYE